MKFGPNLLSLSIAGLRLILKRAITLVNVYKGFAKHEDFAHNIPSSSILENNYKNSHSNEHPSESFQRLHDPIHCATPHRQSRQHNFKGGHRNVDHNNYVTHARPFGIRVPRPYLHMLGSPQ